MLVAQSRSVRRRVVTILIATAGVAAGGVLLARLGGLAGVWDWPPQPSSRFGVGCGIVGGAVVLFEMALWPRKWLRGWRLGAAKVWMWLHVWLGLACLPMILVHAGFGFGGPLTTVTLWLFLLVTASGVWGLVMQQWLPGKMLAELPGETVASQVGFVAEYHVKEVTRLVDDLVYGPAAFDDLSEAPAPVVAAGPPADELGRFRDDVLVPYLRLGRPSGSPLVSRAEAERQFARLRGTLPPAAHPALARLAELTDLRRQWDNLARLNTWLHNWLLVHLPLSVAMTGLMLLHAVRALKYW